MRHNRGFTEFDPRISHLAINIVQDRCLFLRDRHLRIDHSFYDGLHSIRFRALINNARVLSCKSLPRCASRIVNFWKPKLIGRKIGIARLDSIQGADLVG